MNKVDESMNVFEVIDFNPELEEVFLAHGLNCVGCPGSSMETIREAAEGHGIDINGLLEDINKVLMSK